MTKPDSFTFFFTNVAWKISQQESVCVCVAQRTTAAHIACLTPAHLCLQQFCGKWKQQGGSNCHLQDVCLHLCLFSGYALRCCVCVDHKTKPNPNKPMRKNENKQTKMIKRKWEVNNKWSRQSFPLERADSWMR